MDARRDGRRRSGWPGRRARHAVLCPLAILASAFVASPAAAVLTREQVLERARDGASAEQILARSFPGSTVQRSAGVTLRVLVADLTPRVIVSGQTALALVDEGARGETPTALAPNHRYELTRRGSGWRIRDLDDPAGASRP